MSAMTAMNEQRLTLPDGQGVSSIAFTPKTANACLVLAHGAGAGMRHAFMEALATRLAARHVATLRYQFPYMEQGGRRVDSEAVATATVRAAVEAARRQFDGPLFAGGKSFGGRMTSTAEAAQPLGVSGLVFVGFPLHAAGKPGTARAEHLREVEIPMLFLQGTRDTLADLALIRQVTQPLRPLATLETFDDADHSFHVRKSSGWDDEQVLDALADRTVSWMNATA